MRTRLTVGKQLAIGISALIACVVVLSFTSLRVISKLGTSLDRAVNGTGEKLDLLAGTRDGYQRLKARSTQEQVSFAIGELARRSPNGAQWTCQACHTPSPADETLRDIKASATGIQQRTAELHGLVTDESEIKALDTLNRGAAQWVGNTQDYLRLDTSNHFDDAHAILRDQMFPLIEETDTAADLLAEKERAELAASHQQAKLEIAGGRWAVFIVILINLCVAFVLLWLVRRMTAELRLMASELSESAGQVASAAGQISSSSQSLAQGASEQAASLEETSASSEEINSMARKNAENSQHANSLVTQSQQKFDETNQSLEAMVAAMGDIKDSSDKVAKIIKVIDEIAFQTNILALNAAVEAARAGEAGMGFAVVADEVRNLAQRCAQAAKDTAALIEESIVKSNDGKNKVDQVAVAIRAITEESARVKTLFEEVTVGSEEQTRGIEQVAKALTQMEQVTQQAAANAEESAAAAEELTAQASTLMEVVHQLSAMVGGGETVNAASSSHRVSTINYGTAAGNSFCTDSDSMPMVYAAAAKK